MIALCSDHVSNTVAHSPISGDSLRAIPRLSLPLPHGVFFSLAYGPAAPAQTKEKALGFQNSLHAQQETMTFPTSFHPTQI